SFIKNCVQQAKLSLAQENALRVYNKWARRYQEHNSDKKIDPVKMIAKSDLPIIFRTSRLLHFCRAPILFNSKSDDQQPFLSTKVATTNNLTTNVTTNSTPQWYKEMVDRFLGEYSSYLETIGMHVVIGGK